jgi:hypothetical protein
MGAQRRVEPPTNPMRLSPEVGMPAHIWFGTQRALLNLHHWIICLLVEVEEQGSLGVQGRLNVEDWVDDWIFANHPQLAGFDIVKEFRNALFSVM